MRVPITLQRKLLSSPWDRFPSLCVIDEIVTHHPEIVLLVKEEVQAGLKLNGLGRGDSPSVDFVLRSALYKELRGVTYRELARHLVDSRICELFTGVLEENSRLEKSALQDYISKISKDSLNKVMIELNKIAISWGLEDLSEVRGDTTVIQSPIHYPTNASLVWDSIKSASRLLIKIDKRLNDGAKKKDYEESQSQAKKLYYQINVSERCKHEGLFSDYLPIVNKLIKEIDLLLLDDDIRGHLQEQEQVSLLNLVDLMRQVATNATRHELEGQKVANADKIFSIYESHTDIIVKGKREVEFGHKVLFASGKSNLIVDVDIPRGNPADSDLSEDEIKRIKSYYDRTPMSVAYDGGFASQANIDKLQQLEVKNIVFNKTVGGLKNVTQSEETESRLKKWRAGMEAVISNVKRGFDLVRCAWKGWKHFQAKVYWSVIGYNIRTMSRNIIRYMKANPVIDL